MRILCLHSSSDLYGASKIFLQTIELLQTQGHECIVIVSSEGPLTKALKDKGIIVHIFSLGIIRRKYFTPWGLYNRYQKWQNATKKILALHQETSFDIIYSNTVAVWIGAMVTKAIFKIQGEQVRHIWHVHEIITSPRFLFKYIQLQLIKNADAVIVVSKAVQQHWNHQALQHKMQLVYNGIQPIQSIQPNDASTYHQSLNIPNDSIVIGMAGRIHFWKGQTYFIDIANAFYASSMEHALKDKVYFIITGDAFAGYEYLETELKNKIKALGLEHKIFVTGYESNMHRFYTTIDVLVLPSQLPDPLPTVVLEAMQYGKPVIATAQGGALEMLDENTGIIIPLQDANKGAEAIRSLLPSMVRENKGAAAITRVNTYFSAEAFEQKMSQVFNQ